MLDLVPKIGPGQLLSRFEQQGIDCWHLNFDEISNLQEIVPYLAASNIMVIPGKPRKLPSGFAAAGVAFVELGGINKVRQYSPADQVISVDAGITFEKLDTFLAEKNQWCPVQVPDAAQTIGQIVENGDGGCLEHGFGGPRDLVLGLELVLATGELIKCGGMVVKNVTGYDLRKLFIGSRSHLALTTAVNLRLYARPEMMLSFIWKGRLNELIQAQLQLMDSNSSSGLPLSCLELVSGRQMGLVQDATGIKTVTEENYLCVQIYGNQDHIQQASNSLKVLLHNLELVKTAEDQSFWNSLAGTSRNLYQYSLELLLERGFLKTILNEEFLNHKSLIWQARISKGWLKISTESMEQLEYLVLLIEKLALKHSRQIIMSYQDHRYEHRVRQLPKDDAEANKLKELLKSRYDPNGCLNPLVRL